MENAARRRRYKMTDETPEWFVEEVISEWKTRRGEGDE
jgi:hypothetical protein